MNVRAVRAVALKDLRVLRKTRAVVVPLIVVPAVILIGLPLLFGTLFSLPADSPISPYRDLAPLLERLPAPLQARLAGTDPAEQGLVLALGYLLAPIYLILPLMVAAVVAADSFAGEKERKTLEALLYTPTSDRELFLAKVIASLLPALAVSLVGFVIYALIANLVAWPVLGRVFLPNATWLVLVLWLAPAVAGLGLGATVLVSARVRTFQEAFQLAGVVVLPLVALIVAQLTGIVYLSVQLMLAAGLVLWLVDGLLLQLGFRLFTRDGLATRL